MYHRFIKKNIFKLLTTRRKTEGYVLRPAVVYRCFVTSLEVHNPHCQIWMPYVKPKYQNSYPPKKKKISK